LLHIIFEKSNNADRDVAEDIFNLYNTEAVMQQGILYDEAQHTLGHDDVAGIRYAMSGLDELAGTPDDYTISLTYAGLNPFANITIGFNHTRTSFASTFVNSSPPTEYSPLSC